MPRFYTYRSDLQRTATSALAHLQQIEASHREADRQLTEQRDRARRTAAFRLRRARRVLGTAIVARREALGLDAAQIARIARVNASELSKLERGTIGYTGTIAQKVCDALTAIEQERAERSATEETQTLKTA